MSTSLKMAQIAFGDRPRGKVTNMASKQQWVTDYLSAFKAANGQGATLVPAEGGFRVVADDGGSTGFTYTEAEILHRTKRLRERAAQVAA